jgi:hypothetical protein
MAAFVPDSEHVAWVNQHMLSWRQGDVATNLVEIRHIADLARPLTAAAAEAAAKLGVSTGRAAVTTETTGLVILTQTCDLRRSADQRPFVDLAPLVTLEETVAREAARNLRPRYAPVAALGSTSFADLDVVETIEKSVLATCDRASGWSTDEQIRRFGRAVGRRHARFAFPDDLTRTLSRLTDRIKSKHGRASVEGRLLEQLEEIRVTASPHWAADRVDVFLHFLLPANTTLQSEQLEEYDRLLDDWLSRCIPTGAIIQVDGMVINLNEIDGAQYRNSDPLDLDHLSESST